MSGGQRTELLPDQPAPGAARAMIETDRLDKIFVTVRNERIHALSDISFTVREREFVAVVGPSGCGKSTLLKVVARPSRRDPRTHADRRRRSEAAPRRDRSA